MAFDYMLWEHLSKLNESTSADSSVVKKIYDEMMRLWTSDNESDDELGLDVDEVNFETQKALGLGKDKSTEALLELMSYLTEAIAADKAGEADSDFYFDESPIDYWKENYPFFFDPKDADFDEAFCKTYGRQIVDVCLDYFMKITGGKLKALIPEVALTGTANTSETVEESAKRKKVANQKSLSDEDIPDAVGLTENLSDLDVDKLFYVEPDEYNYDKDNFNSDFDGIKEVRIDLYKKDSTKPRGFDRVSGIGVIVSNVDNHNDYRRGNGSINYIVENSTGNEITNDDEAVARALGIDKGDLQAVYDYIYKLADDIDSYSGSSEEATEYKSEYNY